MIENSESATIINIENKKEGGFKLPETVPTYYLLIAIAIILILSLFSIRNISKIRKKEKKLKDKAVHLKEKKLKAVEIKEEIKDKTIEDREIAEYYNSLSEEDRKLISPEEVNSIIEFYGSVIAKSVIKIRLDDRKSKV